MQREASRTLLPVPAIYKKKHLQNLYEMKVRV